MSEQQLKIDKLIQKFERLAKAFGIQPCIECDRDTSYGSGLFINRIPADNSERDGLLCVECWSIECDHCGELSSEFGSDDQGGMICDHCADERGYFDV
jgi:hypothetical protein